ncbi:MAG: acetyltransferase [Bifidobacteriaceae bacterium]|nr:acetyltransferase [Bifidobacteriaceae bacterium]
MQRIRGIDGLKGLSILAILAYHLFGRWLPGGFIGIEIFFTISGFLTARGLLIRLNTTHHLGLRRYFVRRARRVVPAVWLMAILVVAVAWIGNASDALVGIRSRLLSVFTFTSNWYDIVVGADYFASTGPELFKHLWFISLLVQFYVIAPLIVWFFWKYWEPVHAGVAVLVLACGSALAMGVIFVPGTDPTRVYFGTDTHFFGLLVGVALAFFVDGKTHASTDTSDVFENHRRRYLAAALVGSAALVGVILLMVLVIRQDSSAFRGGLLAVALLTALILVGSMVPRSFLGMALSWRPLAALGKYSFATYLWHWPIATLLTFWIPRWRSPGLPYIGLITLALTGFITWVSYIFVEKPIATRGFFRALLPEIGCGAKGWMTWCAAVIIVLLGVAGCTRGVQSAPGATQTELLLRANKQLHSLRYFAGPEERPQKKEPHDVIKEAPPAPSREMPRGKQISAVGDSVMLAAEPALDKTLPGIAVDAQESRSLPAGIGIIAKLKQNRTLREYLVVGLGTNSLITPAELDEVRTICGPGRVLVLVNAHAQRSWIDPTNTAIAQYVDKHSDQVILVDWNTVAAAHESELYSDGIHPIPGKGANLYASAVADAIKYWTQRH